MKYNDITLGQVEAVWNKLGGVEGVQSFLRGEIVVKPFGLLRKVATVHVSGIERFVAEDHFKAANVCWTGDNFKQFFVRKVEEGVKEIIVVIHRLEKTSFDVPILGELGDRAEIRLAHLFSLIKKQSKGESGVLLTNGYANIAYVKGRDGGLWVVGAHWRSDCGYWSVGADSVGYPFEWHGGPQVLSRDS